MAQILNFFREGICKPCEPSHAHSHCFESGVLPPRSFYSSKKQDEVAFFEKYSKKDTLLIVQNALYLIP